MEYDLNIISGLAIGIDGIAHKTCLECQGKTVAVIPSGFENVYPREHADLFEKIIKSGGIVVSEYEPETAKKAEYCLERNRIVSGLGIATFVIEAGFKSGTSVTAKYTKEQGKFVFCLPNSLDNENGIGTNKLIKNGAILVTEVQDIVSKFEFLKKTKLKNSKKEVKEKIINKDYMEIYDLINTKPTSVENIIKESGLPANEVISKITMMELEEYIKLLPGNKIIKI